MGYVGGSRGVRKLKEEKLGLTEREAVMAFIDLFNRAAWGETELISMGEEEVVIRIRHTCGEGYGKVGRDVC